MKKVKYQNYTEKEAIEYTATLMDYGVVMIVYAALNEVLNAYIMLRQSKHYRQDIKRRANNTLEIRNRKVKELSELVMNRGFAETYWDAVIDACETDVAHFKAEIKAILDREEVEESDLYSQTETARVLLEAAKIHFEEVIKECNTKFLLKNFEEMKDLNLSDIFHEFYVDKIFREWNSVCEQLYKYKEKDIVLSNKDTLDAFNTMAEKFAKGLYIDECLNKAKKEHPEFASLSVKVEE